MLINVEMPTFFYSKLVSALKDDQLKMGHTFNPSSWKAEAGVSMSSRPAWSTSEF